jgi:LysM repeat protein
MAGKAGKAAPALAIAGAIVSAPQLQGVASAATTQAAGTAASASAPAHTGATHTGAVPTPQRATLDAAAAADRTYQVRSGDTLSAIAQRFYGSDGSWHWLYEQNTATISDPNMIFPGQVIDLPSGAQARDAAATGAASTGTATSETSEVSQTSHAAAVGTAASSTPVASASSGSLSGTLGCSGLEQLWIEAGGNQSEAFMAAEIAMAESGGNQFAVSPTSDYGYWQINAVHGSQATFSPLGNAEAAVSISADGADWEPWTTYQSGAYQGRC